MNNRFGEFVRESRISKDISLRKLAELSGISFSHLSKIERGEHVPSKETIEVLSKSLEIDEYELLVLAGYSTEADEIFWSSLFKNIDPSYNLLKYQKQDGSADVIKFRNDFVHGNLDDALAEAVSDYFFNEASKYSSNYNKKTNKRLVSEVKEELDNEYQEWLELIDILRRKKYKPQNVLERLEFFNEIKMKIKEIDYKKFF